VSCKIKNKSCTTRGLNSRPSCWEASALPTVPRERGELLRCWFRYTSTCSFFPRTVSPYTLAYLDAITPDHSKKNAQSLPIHFLPSQNKKQNKNKNSRRLSSQKTLTFNEIKLSNQFDSKIRRDYRFEILGLVSSPSKIEAPFALTTHIIRSQSFSFWSHQVRCVHYGTYLLRARRHRCCAIAVNFRFKSQFLQAESSTDGIWVNNVILLTKANVFYSQGSEDVKRWTFLVSHWQIDFQFPIDKSRKRKFFLCYPHIILWEILVFTKNVLFRSEKSVLRNRVWNSSPIFFKRVNIRRMTLEFSKKVAEGKMRTVPADAQKGHQKK